MKEIKAQQDILALAHTPNRVRFGHLADGRTGAVIDGIAVYIMDSDNVLLDTSKFMSFDLQKHFVDVVESTVIIPTGTCILQNKTTLKEFKKRRNNILF